jgi:hypothetical protein
MGRPIMMVGSHSRDIALKKQQYTYLSYNKPSKVSFKGSFISF